MDLVGPVWGGFWSARLPLHAPFFSGGVAALIV